MEKHTHFPSLVYMKDSMDRPERRRSPSVRDQRYRNDSCDDSTDSEHVEHDRRRRRHDEDLSSEVESSESETDSDRERKPRTLTKSKSRRKDCDHGTTSSWIPNCIKS